MPAGPKVIKDKINEVLNAWKTLPPEKTFFGLTLTQFEARLQSSLGARSEIIHLENRLKAMQAHRKHADQENNQLLLSVVSSVKGDPEHGEDSALYQAMGYIRKSARKSGLTRNKGTNEVTTQNQAA